MQNQSLQTDPAHMIVSAVARGIARKAIEQKLTQPEIVTAIMDKTKQWNHLAATPENPEANVSVTYSELAELVAAHMISLMSGGVS